MKNILIIEARFYDQIADELAHAAITEIKNSQMNYERISVPGCFEIPAALSMAIKSRKYDAYICLGCVIRGETSHYDYVCSESARGINDLAIKKKAAIGYGIITAENKDQALHRSSIEGKNVGGRAAKAAIDMLKIKNELGVK